MDTLLSFVQNTRSKLCTIKYEIFDVESCLPIPKFVKVLIEKDHKHVRGVGGAG